ncbi:hypothetical protein [Actinoplanes sp. DH11]|uniref:hypothetical protein n=1 Tax=Actinoplanes sp. DH11 TaxID=2857011 RepID=UPI001E5930D1|nr:hypothetical protein [Actinoplanes sp. DH11]
MEQQRIELARQLRALGMWASLSEEEAAAAEQTVANGGYPFSIDEPLEGVGWFFTDGEALAEGQIKWVLSTIEPALRRHGVDLQVEVVHQPRVNDEEGDYIIAINGRPCVMWSQEDWPARRARRTATVRPLAVLNDLLAEAGATVRLFTLYTGAEDGISWLLDPRIVAAVTDSGLYKESDVPALARHD